MYKNIKAIAADVDGTLVVKGGNLTPKSRAAFNKLHKEGILFGIASGRPIDNRISDYAKNWGLDFGFDFIIGVNGGELYDTTTKKIEKYYTLSRETIREILEMLVSIGANAIIYKKGYDEIYALKWDFFLEESQKRNESFIKVGMVDELSAEETGKVEVHLRVSQKQQFLQMLKEHPSDKYSYIQTFEEGDHCTIEFMDPRVNKGLALEKVSEHFNIPLEDIMAIGDMDNDIGLLEKAGVAVCMKNGSPGCKAVADIITEYDVFHDGVGQFLETAFEL